MDLRILLRYMIWYNGTIVYSKIVKLFLSTEYFEKIKVIGMVIHKNWSSGFIIFGPEKVPVNSTNGQNLKWETSAS